MVAPDDGLLPADRMPEAEVAARLAFWILRHPACGGEVEMAVDGAQVEVGGRTTFDLGRFLEIHGWEMDRAEERDRWRGTYRNAEHPGRSLRVHSRAGVGDVVGAVGGKRVRAECKKGPLTRSRSGSEIRLLREALAQLLTVAEVGENDVLVAAVPATPAFRRHAASWRDAPLVRRVGLRVVLLGRAGDVDGLDL